MTGYQGPDRNGMVVLSKVTKKRVRITETD